MVSSESGFDPRWRLHSPVVERKTRYAQDVVPTGVRVQIPPGPPYADNERPGLSDYPQVIRCLAGGTGRHSSLRNCRREGIPVRLRGEAPHPLSSVDQNAWFRPKRTGVRSPQRVPVGVSFNGRTCGCYPQDGGSIPPVPAKSRSSSGLGCQTFNLEDVGSTPTRDTKPT